MRCCCDTAVLIIPRQVDCVHCGHLVNPLPAFLPPPPLYLFLSYSAQDKLYGCVRAVLCLLYEEQNQEKSLTLFTKKGGGEMSDSTEEFRPAARL
mmetsp:Transcript_32484/g.52640  ORF Transcript_32484/g.52640 Transcript_32484/m.52640 type:complete len:95 (+) Transcript_32484:356-640(+)